VKWLNHIFKGWYTGLDIIIVVVFAIIIIVIAGTSHREFWPLV
jgi:hypothetical protein